MSGAYICDRCGTLVEQVEGRTHYTGLWIAAHNEKQESLRYCWMCTTEMFKWLAKESMKKEGDPHA